MRLFAFFCFPPGISLSAKGRPRPKCLKNPRISRFPARGGPVGQNVKCEKVAHFRGETSGGFQISPSKVPPALGNCFLPFSAQARDFSKCQGPSSGPTSPSGVPRQDCDCGACWFPPLRMAQTHRYEQFVPTRCTFSRISGGFGLCV